MDVVVLLVQQDGVGFGQGVDGFEYRVERLGTFGAM